MTASARAAIANRTVSRSGTGIRVTTSLIMKKVEPQAAVMASRASSGPSSPRRTATRRAAGQTTYRVIVEPFGASLFALGLE